MDPYTIIAYTASILALMSLLFLAFGANGGRHRSLLWFGLPLCSGASGAFFLARPTVLPGLLALQLGAWFILLAYGLTWQAMRALYSRYQVLVFVITPPTLWFFLSVFLFGPHSLTETSAFVRSLILVCFQALTAREFWTARSERLPARAALLWIFAGYAVYAVAKLCLISYLPMPLGGLPTRVWAVILDNITVVTQVILAGAFVIALSQERVSLKHYRMAMLDPLTGVSNRRAFNHVVASRGSSTCAGQLVLMILDIDHFKSVNDKFGHDVGDEVIKLLASTASDIVGTHESVFRMGGEEFVCLLQGLDADASYFIAEQIRTTFRTRAAEVASCKVNSTVSIGLSESNHPQEDLSVVLRRADKALYQAKSGGRNQSAIVAPAGRSHGIIAHP